MTRKRKHVSRIKNTAMMIQNSADKTSMKVVQDTDLLGLVMKRWYLKDSSGTAKSTTCLKIVFYNV